MSTNDLTKKLKKLKHVQVYNTIFQLIQDGTYSPGMQLPSEPELARQLNVSRMTLRKSLALLQEDHLIKNIRGKGNFILKTPETKYHQGFEYLQHPIYASLSSEITKVELEYRIEVPTVAITASLKQETPVVIIVDRWYHSQNKAIAYSLSFIPIEVISKYAINLNQEEPLLTFLEEKIYESGKASHSCNQIGYTKTGNYTATKYTLSENSAFILIQETLYNGKDILVSTKHYVPADLFDLKVQSQSCQSDTH
ncbi:TPA: GntR family transcriptional regulator [Streptococcus pyogenes]|uniref:GntR family transcriptional regulator n=1 Tax=Streptococcus pyogenes TaxID=1314 RepID=A0A5S4TDF9_STRPY|nr:GntR family transcriptional regulator [Streptococcus pyogenes]EPZ48800.1 HTH domain protein [Streptococcus pyogenes GA40634]HER4522462.1 GntR family transcriptional regulator [Streptococcus pyogenes NGAS760]HER4525919.1 GntR family transcriptional regulator [Streptococcus pyogenes NGAS758]HER4529240.1 GntR family transcriptional regulator [Streptococcus pyogenes NGAS746]HER4530929.1 GntR family transcriptional regulator [Streptococcus pyogenes NGAS759]HER4533991.1 GntR family transcription